MAAVSAVALPAVITEMEFATGSIVADTNYAMLHTGESVLPRAVADKFVSLGKTTRISFDGVHHSYALIGNWNMYVGKAK